MQWISNANEMCLWKLNNIGCCAIAGVDDDRAKRARLWWCPNRAVCAISRWAPTTSIAMTNPSPSCSLNRNQLRRRPRFDRRYYCVAAPISLPLPGPPTRRWTANIAISTICGFAWETMTIRATGIFIFGLVSSNGMLYSFVSTSEVHIRLEVPRREWKIRPTPGTESGRAEVAALRSHLGQWLSHLWSASLVIPIYHSAFKKNFNNENKTKKNTQRWYARKL